MQTAIVVDLGIGAEGLHHRLIDRGHAVGVLDNLVAIRQHRVHVAVAAALARAQVALIIRPDRAERPPVILGVHQNRVILGRVEVQNRLEHPIFYFDEL